VLKLLERNIASIERRLVLLAPSHAAIPETFTNVTMDPSRHLHLVREMQKIRGAIYLHQGSVKRDQLSTEGLHQTPEDEKSWHLLWTDTSGQVSSCAWYLEHGDATSIQQLRVRHCPLARAAEWREKLTSVVGQEITRARRAGIRYAEVGGWAVSQARRCTSEGLVLALAAYGLCRTLGGALGITNANLQSSSILRRLGGSYLEFNGTPIPSYFDSRYNTRIELLRFDSRSPSTKYVGLIETLKSKLADVPVVAPSKGPMFLMDGFMAPIAEPSFAS
jgi:hypothetical protein